MTTLLGREPERERLDQLLEVARGGCSGVLVLRGEPGIGKTALLDYALGAAADMTVLRASGVESEMELAFAGLHQLCAPLLGMADRLPPPQREALETTFGLCAGPVPDRFFVRLAVLSLLSDAAESGPILCVVDDAQWLDEASAHAFSFVARRLLAEPVVMLFATRAPGETTVGLPELVVEGLPDPDSRALLASVLHGRLDERIAEQILAEAQGNPLALLELPRGTPTARLAGGFGLPAAPPLQNRLEESFVQRLKALPDDGQRLLLVAAAEPLGDPMLLWSAAERLGIAAEAIEPAESAGLVAIDQRVRFHHPLVRSAVYGAASAEECRQVHRALAESTDPAVDPERRAWHLAEATVSPVEEVAAELDRAAGQAQARGGLAAAAAFLERAAALTVDPGLRGRRMLSAASTKFEAGALDDALALLPAVERCPLDPGQRAEMHLVRARVAFAVRRGSDAPPLLLKAAHELEAFDPDLARATYLEAMSAAMFAGRLAQGGGVVEVSRAALASPPSTTSTAPSDLLLRGLAVRFTEGYASGAPVLKEALGAFRRDEHLAADQARWLWFASWIALYLWDDDAWTDLSSRHLDLVREEGAMTALPFVLSNRSSVCAFRGELSDAVALEDELKATTEATGIAAVPYGALSLTALRGQQAEFSELARTVGREAEERGEGLALAVTEFVAGTLHNGLGDYEAALAAVADAERFPEEGPVMWSLTELIEAAVRSGQPERGKPGLELIVETTQAAGTDWGLGIEARCRALLANSDEAEAFYVEAIERLARSGIRVQHARAHLLYGEWLRRQRRRFDAREQLRTANEMFVEMGIEAFAERAARELLATGEHARKRTVETGSDLTPQESQIARLARDGLSNAEIGERLFISKNTVEYHLRKVFTKLAINSRVKLALALPPDAQHR